MTGFNPHRLTFFLTFLMISIFYYITAYIEKIFPHYFVFVFTIILHAFFSYSPTYHTLECAVGIDIRGFDLSAGSVSLYALCPSGVFGYVTQPIFRIIVPLFSLRSVMHIASLLETSLAIWIVE